MLIAEDLLLLVTDDTSGELSVPAAKVDLGLAGANLIDLALRDRVDLSESEPGRIIVRDPTPTGDAVLDDALEIVRAHEGDKPSAAIRPLSRHLRQTLYARLAGAGLVHADEGRILGVFPTHRWPAEDARHEADVRRLLTEALIEQAAPDARTAALIALLHALGCEHKVVDPGAHGLSTRQLRARAERIAAGNWASAAVRETIVQMIAVVAATTAATSVVVLPGAR